MGWWSKTKEKAGDAWDATKGVHSDAWNWYKDETNRDQNNMQGRIADQADAASGFANTSQEGFGRLGAEATQERDYLRGIARGDESVSRMQLAQSLQRNQSMQQSMAAGAAPQNQAAGARQAMMNAGRQGAALAGQQAVAGIQERQQAQNALAQMLMQQRQQELSAAQGARGQAIQGYGTAYTGAMATPTGLESGMQLGMSAAQAGAALSDERLKKDVKDEDGESDKLMKALKGYTFNYKNSEHGKGKHLGVMAQDLEKILPQAVFETKEGKAINGGHLSAALATMMPKISKRLEALESKGNK